MILLSFSEFCEQVFQDVLCDGEGNGYNLNISPQQPCWLSAKVGTNYLPRLLVNYRPHSIYLFPHFLGGWSLDQREAICACERDIIISSLTTLNCCYETAFWKFQIVYCTFPEPKKRKIHTSVLTYEVEMILHVSKQSKSGKIVEIKHIPYEFNPFKSVVVLQEYPYQFMTHMYNHPVAIFLCS